MTPANITALQSLVQADPALAQQLQSAATSEAATQLLAKAASQKGLALDAHAIADYLKTSQTTEISDAELEAVAGGAEQQGRTYSSRNTGTYPADQNNPSSTACYSDDANPQPHPPTDLHRGMG